MVSEEEAQRLIMGELLLRAKEARNDLTKFFEFVVEEETTREPLKVAPHQQIMFDFILAHAPKCVIRLPVQHAKTYGTMALAMYLLGKDSSMRGAIVSATQDQAEKPLRAIRDYIEGSQRLRLVFPDLRKSPREGDPWNQTKLTVDRRYGIRDPSLTAIGYESQRVPGSRWNWILIDDLVMGENCDSPEKREKMYGWVTGILQSRLDTKGERRIIVTNTAWHPEDVPHKLEEAGWPTLTMRIDGDILITNSNWDSPLIRPKDPYTPECRLVAHDPDPNNQIQLWPEKFPDEEMKRLRDEFLPLQFNQLYMNLCRDDGSAMCKMEYIDRCKALARESKYYHLQASATQPNITFMGVDLAFAEHSKADDTAFFIFEVLPDGRRLILDIESGKYDTPTVIDKIAEKSKRYNATVMVEDNGAQKAVIQMLRRQHVSIPVTAYTTHHQSKANPQYGLPVIFNELRNGLWLIPNDQYGRCEKQIQKFIDQCLHYEPSKHTGDILMAAFFARTKALKFGALSGAPVDGNTGKPGIAATLMSR